MSELDKFVLEFEAKEAAEDMHFSVYYVPDCYKEVDIDYSRL